MSIARPIEGMETDNLIDSDFSDDDVKEMYQACVRPWLKRVRSRIEAHVMQKSLPSTHDTSNIETLDAPDGDLPFMHRDIFNMPLGSSVEGSDVEIANEYTRESNSTKYHIEKRSDSKENIILCDSSIILFSGENNAQVKEDVTNSLILAQLNADKQLDVWKEKHNKKKDLIDELKVWYTVFSKTFNHMKWIDTGYTLEQAQVSGSVLSVEKMLVDVIESIGNDEEKKKFQSALKVLKSIPEEDNRMQLFNKRSASRDYAQLLLHSVYIDKTGAAEMKTTMLGLTTKMSVTNVLWFQWSDGDTKVFKIENKLMLGSNAYESMRKVVQSKIQQINESFVQYIPM